MLLSRENLERREKETLAPFAAKSAESRGRTYPEAEDPFRTCFQRDRGRIIHSKAFRRLKGKTQVFIAHYGDHYRSRLVHTMEVAQLARDMARTLSLNEDLAETIALAHDLGHTPFGHAGQEALDELMKKEGFSFEHNEQSRRIVTVLETKKSSHPGLNLTFEVIDGMAKHREPIQVVEPHETIQPSLEAQVVDIADKIAYLNHDIDDGIRSDILNINDLETLTLWQRATEKVDESLPFSHFISASISSLMKLMVNDLVSNTDRLINIYGIKSLKQINKNAERFAVFSDEFSQECKKLKQFLYEHFYHAPSIEEYNKKGKEIIHFLFDELVHRPSLLPDKLSENEDDLVIQVKDHIAMMTDEYATDLYDKLHWKAFSRPALS